MKTYFDRIPWSIALAVALAGCAVGPDYERPSVNLPAQFKEAPAGWAAAAPAENLPKGAWWAVFGDPLLDELAPQVAVSNQSVAQSEANWRAALAQVQFARSALFPTVGASAGATRQRTNPTGGAGARPLADGAGLQGTVSWAPDLWGRARHSVEAGEAGAQASAALLANATLAQQIALANAVIGLRATDATTDLLHKTVTAYREFLRVVADQDAAGTATPSNLISARVQLKSAQANLVALGVARAQYVHAIAVLVGKPPEALSIPHHAVLPQLPQVPVGVPSELLQRRPDIAVAERQMAVQNATIGVAQAAYYPSFTLTAADGFTQSPLAGLLSVSNHVWSLGLGLTGALFDGGARDAQVATARAQYEAAVANYRGTVLAALRNVEDDLSGLRILAERTQVLEGAVQDAEQAAQIATNQYSAGTVDFTTVANAQAVQLNLEQTLLAVRQQRLADTVALIGDLGGGWSTQSLATASRVDAKP